MVNIKLYLFARFNLFITILLQFARATCEFKPGWDDVDNRLSTQGQPYCEIDELLDYLPVWLKGFEAEALEDTVDYEQVI